MGYQIGVTPLQMVAAVGSIANGGELIAPHVVRATVVDGVRTEVPRRSSAARFRPDIADELTTILEQVVERGTAKAARIPGYTIAGKTGTAEKLENGRYSKVHNNVSFVGFVPSRHPRAVILAIIDSPRRGGRTGGDVAAPIFRAVAEATLRQLGVAPNVPDPHGLLAGPTRAGRADAGQPAGARAPADARRARRRSATRAGHAARRPRPVGARGDARAARASASSRGSRAAASSQRQWPAAGTVDPPRPVLRSGARPRRRATRSGDAGSSHDPGAAPRTASSLVALDLVAPLGAADRARAGRRRRVRLAPRSSPAASSSA